LTAAILDRHSRIAVPPETHFFTQLCQEFRPAARAERQFMMNRFLDRRRVRDLGLEAGELLERIQSVEPTWANLFLEAIKLYARGRGKEIAGEKTPDHWAVTPQLLTLFPDSRVVWVVRDGRDTMLSLMNVPWRAHSNLALHALKWQRMMARMLDYERQFPERILRLKFEELVRNPQAETERVCRFIGVDFEAGQLDVSTATGVVPAWEMEWKGRVFDPPDRSRIGTGRREFSGKSLELLEAVMGPTLRQLGYDVEQSSARGTARGFAARE
jgi:hypothetical protein